VSPDLNGMAVNLLKELKLRRFPEDFLPENYEGLTLRTGPFREISMYRELEGVNLLIDDRRIFFGSIQQAKFALISLKSGHEEVRIPEENEAKTALRHYRRYVAEVETSLITWAQKYDISVVEREELIRICMEILLGSADYDQV
jgi:hypothetical protein